MAHSKPIPAYSMRFLTKEVKTVEELRERTIRGEVNERIKAAFERAAEIEECRRQGHVMESSLEEKENKFEAGIQYILDLLTLTEDEYHQGHFPMVLALVKDVRRKLVALAEEEGSK